MLGAMRTAGTRKTEMCNRVATFMLATNGWHFVNHTWQHMRSTIFGTNNMSKVETCAKFAALMFAKSWHGERADFFGFL
jgi:hypothetical protein